MERNEQVESEAAIDWSRFLGASILFCVTLASTAMAVGGWFLIDNLIDFLGSNALSADRRLVLAIIVLAAGALGAAICALTVWLRGPRGATAIIVASRRFAPLALLWAIGALATNHVWQAHKLTFLILLGGTLLLLERSLWVSGMTFSGALGDALSERYARVPASLQRFMPSFAVLTAATLFAAYTGFWSIEQHHRLATSSFDLGIVDNVMFNALHGHGMRAPVLFGADGGSLLAGHANFVLFLLLPFYALSPRAETLLIIQSVLLGFAAVPLYGFAKEWLPRPSAAFIGIAYLLFAPLHGLNFYDFHYLPICIFFLFALFWALSTNRPILTWILWAICVSIREDVSIGLCMLGVFMVVSGYRVRTGVWMATLSAVAFALIKFVIMPWAGTWWFASLYKDLMPEGQQSYGGIILTLLTNPAYVISTLLTKEKLIYALHLLAPLVFLPLRRWSFLWLLFAGFFLTLLTTGYKPTVSITFQYTSHWIPYLFGASVVALATMGASRSGVVHRRAATIALVVGVVLQSLSFGAVLRPTDFVGGFSGIPFHVTEAERARYRDLQEVIAMIPPDATVAATDPETPHITNRLTAYPFRMGAGGADYLLIRRLARSSERKHAQRAVDEYRYGLLANVGDFYLFKRGHEDPGTAGALRKVRLKPGKARE